MFHEVFETPPSEFIAFLADQKTEANIRTQFSSFTVKQSLNTFNIENIILHFHLCKAVYALPNHDVIQCKQKFSVFKSVFSNRCFNETCREKVVDLYCKIQRRYLALSRFAYLWKLKRASTCVDTDLYLNTIEPTKKNAFILFQNNKKYCFVMTDLVKLIEQSICHKWEDDFEIKSENPCNPYNKQPLLSHDLYNIYFHMRCKMDMVIPPFIHLWFMNGFDLLSFPIKHSRLLRKMCIKNHVFNVSNTSNLMYNDIREMIFANIYTRKWLIHPDFPRQTLVDIMRPYLYIYYLVTYDVLESEEQMWYEATLALELLKFYKYNPSFGRRLVNPSKKSNPDKFVYEFGDMKENDLKQEKYYFNKDMKTFSSRSY